MVAYYNEFDEKAAAWLRELIARGLIADGVVDTRSIEDVEPRQLTGFTQCHFFAGIGVWSYALRRAGISDDTPVWTGSCPCQPFSAAGKGGGFDDERHLWPAWQWLIEQRRPQLIFGEQVASKDAEPWLDLVQADVEAMGYAFGACAFPSAGVGAPHIRDRSYWVADALRDGARDNARAGLGPQAAPDSQDRDLPGQRLRIGRESTSVSLANAGRPRGERGAEASGPGETDARERRENPVHHQPRGGTSGLADSDGGDASAERQQRGGEHGQQPQDGGSGRLADAGGSGQLPSPFAGVHRSEGRPRPRHGELERQGADGGLADATVIGRVGRRAGEAGDAPGQVERFDGLRDAGRLAGHADPHGAGDEREHGLREVATHAGPVNGGWGNADWIYCRNGEWRPVEPGTFPLAHGAPARVGRLRGYGNAINAEAAQVFIESYLETHP